MNHAKISTEKVRLHQLCRVQWASLVIEIWILPQFLLHRCITSILIHRSIKGVRVLLLRVGTHFDLQAWPTSTSPTFLQHWNLNTVFSIQYTWHFSPKYLPSVSLLESLIQWDAMGFGVRQNEFHCYIHQGQQTEKVQRWIWACRVVLAVQKSSEASWWHREQANPSGVLVLVGLPLYRCDWLIGPPACECKWLSH